MSLTFMTEVFFSLLSGIPTTLKLMAESVLIGTVLAMILALMSMSPNKYLAAVSHGYVFIFRGSPLLVQMFLIYYGAGQFRVSLESWNLWWIFREPYWCAVMALALNTAAYMSEIIRGGLQSVPAPQIEAARSIGMSRWLLFRRIIMPVAIRNALPAYGNEVVLMVKATSLASIITVMDITGIAARLISDTFRPIEIFIVAGAIYLAINAIMIGLIMLAEWFLTPHLRAAR